MDFKNNVLVTETCIKRNGEIYDQQNIIQISLNKYKTLRDLDMTKGCVEIIHHGHTYPANGYNKFELVCISMISYNYMGTKIISHYTTHLDNQSVIVGLIRKHDLKIEDMKFDTKEVDFENEWTMEFN